MTPADDVIARAARAMVPYMTARLSESAPDAVTPPSEALIALTLRDMVTRIEPGGRIEDHGLVVEWPQDGPIRILLACAVIRPEERT